MIDVPRKICCPFCSTIHPAPAEAPPDGDLYFCVACGEWLEACGGTWCMPSDTAYHDIHRSPQLRGIMGAWLATKAERL